MRPGFWIVLLAAISIVALLAVGCGDDGDAEGTGLSPDATQEPDDDGDAGTPDDEGINVPGNLDTCGLLTAGEVEAVLGERVAEGDLSASGPYATCTWNASDESSVRFVVLQVRGEVSDEQFQAEREALAGEAQPLGGIGEDAFVFAGSLYVHKRESEIVTMVMDPSQTEDQAIEEARVLTHKVLDRLH